MAGTSRSVVNSSRAMHAVKSKNNIDDLYLRRLLVQNEKERAIRLLFIDHEKLDLREFLKTIKVCGSDELPEAKFWMQGDLAKKQALGGSGDGSAADGESSGTGALSRRRCDDDDAADDDQGVFKTGAPFNQNVHIDIYSKRNEYANLNWVKEYFDEEGYDLTKKPAEVTEDSMQRSPTCTDMKFHQDMLNNRERTGISKSTAKEAKCTGSKTVEEPVLTMREQLLKKLGIAPPSTKDRNPTASSRRRMHSRKTHSTPSPKSQPPEVKPKDSPNDFMKDLLVQNSQKYGQRMKSTPMENRLNDFYKKVKVLMETEADLSNAELEKNWRTITEDVKRVLVESFAKEETAA